MKCKSLILGPAAALLVAPSGALAADAMMKDDMGPVTACEAYGSGWFFAPGTETCLNISGDLRFQFESDSVDGPASDSNAMKSGENWDWRGRVNVQAKSETEAGTLSSRVRFLGSGANGADSDATVDWAVIQLGGFRVGFQDSFWQNDAYGYYNARYDGLYNFDDAILADYTFRANGFAATVGVSDSASDPDFYAGVNWSGGGLTLGVVWFDAQAGGKNAQAAVPGTPELPAGRTVFVDDGMEYDTYAEALAAATAGSRAASTITTAIGHAAAPAVAGTPANPGDGGNAWRIVAAYDLGFVAPGAAIRGWYSDDGGDTDYSAGARWGVTGKVGLGDDLTLFAGYSQYEDETVVTAFDRDDPVDANVPADATNFTIGVAWTPVPGLLVQPEYTVTEYSPLTASTAGGGGTHHPVNADGKTLRDVNTFGVRIVRSF